MHIHIYRYIYTSLLTPQVSHRKHAAAAWLRRPGPGLFRPLQPEANPPPKVGIPRGTIPEGALPEAAIPEGAISEAVIPEGALPEAIIPEGALPETIMPEGWPRSSARPLLP